MSPRLLGGRDCIKYSKSSKCVKPGKSTGKPWMKQEDDEQLKFKSEK